MKRSIHTSRAPDAIGPYSQAVEVGKLLFTSGQVGMVPGATELCSANFSDQAKQVFENLLAIAQAVEADLSNVVKLSVFVTDLANFAEFNEVMEAYFSSPYPARSTVQVSKLPKNALVEVEAILQL